MQVNRGGISPERAELKCQKGGYYQIKNKEEKIIVETTKHLIGRYLEGIALFFKGTSLWAKNKVVSVIKGTSDNQVVDQIFKKMHGKFSSRKSYLVQSSTIPSYPSTKITAPQPPSPKTFLDLNAINQVANAAPQFADYSITRPDLKGLVLTGLSYRPANLFFKKLLAPLCPDGKEPTTLPGKNSYLVFNLDHTQIASFIAEKAKTDDSIQFSYKDTPEDFKVRIKTKDEDKTFPYSPKEIFGEQEYSISYKEIQETLQSQKIYVSSLMPLEFYSGLKKAMIEDRMIILPGSDGAPWLLSELKDSNQYPNVAQFLKQVAAQPTQFGFEKKEDFNFLKDLTIYQIGSMVVKSEDYRIFIDEQGRILDRKVGDKDAFRLINACGIRGLASKKTKAEANQKIMTETFKTSLASAENGIVLFPAVGMGVWGGNPEIYWTAFLDAVIASDNRFDAIYVNPNHRSTHVSWEKYAGKKGEEFKEFLEKYKNNFAHDNEAMSKLNKIQNLFEKKTDLLQLARHLKKAFPDTTVSIFNASDPDVTFALTVGEYTNNMPHVNTTEENYTAMGTNGICFETITGVHKDPTRLFQVNDAGHAISR